MKSEIESLNFCFIGAGNLATHLAKALFNSGFKIKQVFSKTETSAQKLAIEVSAQFTNNISDLTDEADIYVVAIKDSAFSEVLSQCNFQNKLIVHCSGSLSMDSIAKYSSNVGVIYPLQTFSKDREVDFSNIPVFIEANSTMNEEILTRISKRISLNVSVLSSEKRIWLHISAVFACNFVNHFYQIASEILNDKEIDFEVLRPLILETALKVQTLNPRDTQTGPAVRFDKNVIDSHLKKLGNQPAIRDLYEQITKSIFISHNNSENGIISK